MGAGLCCPDGDIPASKGVGKGWEEHMEEHYGVESLNHFDETDVRRSDSKWE